MSPEEKERWKEALKLALLFLIAAAILILGDAMTAKP